MRVFMKFRDRRNSREENKQIKNGGIPEDWDEKKLRHKDTDARWTKKNNETFYGYKNHVKADVGSKLIDDYTVTDASVHDSQTLEELLDEKDAGQKLYADSAYTGQENIVEEAKMQNLIHEKGYRNKPLTPEQKKNNQAKSRLRARVEHIFGFIENSMNRGAFIRCIGKARSRVVIGLTNLTYNICRAVQLNINMSPKCA